MNNAITKSPTTTFREASVGSRAPVVFLHGLLGAPSSWRVVAQELQHQGGLHAETVAGHGPAPRMHASLVSAVDAIADRWAEQPAHFVGYSLGGRLALALAALRPECTLSVVAIGAHPGLKDEGERLRRQRWEMDLCDILVSDGLEAFVAHWEQLPMWESQAALSSELLHHQRETRLSHSPAGVAWALQTLGTGSMPSFHGALQNTEIPITLVAGARDEKFAALNNATATLNPSITAEMVPDVGHNVVLEAPVELAALIRAHLVRSNLAAAQLPESVRPPRIEEPRPGDRR